MRLSKGFVAVAAAAVTVLGLSACTDSAAPESSVDVEEVADFQDGTTMARLAEAGEITIGTKFDQPLFGLDDGSGTPQGFDAEIGKLVAAKLGIPADGMTMIVVTHEMGFARKAADRVVFMAEGQIVEEATPEEFFTAPKSDRARDFLSKILTH